MKTHNGVAEIEPITEPESLRYRDLRLLRAALHAWETRPDNAEESQLVSNRHRKPQQLRTNTDR